MRTTSLLVTTVFALTGCGINLLPIQKGPPPPVDDADSDGDGFLDSEETAAGSDPLDKFSWEFGGERWPDFTDEADLDGYEGDGYALGQVMPTFTAIDQFGNEIDVSTFYGYVILMDFSAGWCGPCHTLAGDAQAMWEQYRLDGFLIIHAVIEDDEEVQDGVVEEGYAAFWADTYGLEFPVVVDEDQQAFGGFATSGVYDGFIPFLVLLDRDMTIDSVYTGDGGDDEATPRIEELLGL